MNEFFFDLQRFVDYTITAGGSATITGTGTKTFSVTVGTNPPTNYSIDLVDNVTTVIVSTDANGTIKLNVTSGSVNNIKNTTTGLLIPFVLLGGTVLTNSQAITFGENGPTIAQLEPGRTNKRVSITLTENGDFNEVNITSETNYIYGFSIGGLSYSPKAENPPQLFAKINKDTGRTYIEVDKYIGSVKYNDSSTYTIKYDDGTGAKTYTPKSGTVTFAIDKDGNNFAVTDLEVGDSFQLGDVVYTMTKQRFIAESSINGEKILKFWNKDLPSSTDEVLMSEINFDSGSKLSPVIILKNGKLDISNNTTPITLLGTEGQCFIVDQLDSSDVDYKVNYGTLKKTTSNGVEYFELTGVAEGIDYEDESKTVIKTQRKKIPAVEIPNGWNVSFNTEVCNVPITVSNASFISTDTLHAFNYTSLSSGAASVGGALSVSLSSGLIQTNNSLQTITASNYSISGYGDNSSGNDGITISLSSSGVFVGDLDKGEYFTDGTSNFTMMASGLLEEKGGNYSLHRNFAAQTPITFTLGTKGTNLIEPDSSKILEVGGANHANGLLFNSKTNPTVGYAEISSSVSSLGNTSYSLTTLSGNDIGDFNSAISTISLVSGETTINKNLVLDKVTIATNAGVTFIVTDSNDTFTVNATKDYPTITGAKALTLTGGTLTVTAGQKIKLGTDGKEFEVLSGSPDMTIIYDATASTFTVTAPATTKGNANFTFDGKEYKVDKSDGMTFSIDSSNEVTVGGLSTGENFTFDGTGYSLQSVGFFKKNSVPSHYIWDKNNSHYLNNSTVPASVTSSDLASNNYWEGLVTVDSSNNITLSPNSSVEGVLIDETFNKIYGKLKEGNNSYSLTGTAEDTGTLSTVFINSVQSPFTLSATGSNFLQNVTIAAPNSSLSIIEATNNSYQVLFDGSGSSLVGAKKASLINGTLAADSNISSGVVVDGYTIIPSEFVTLSTDANGKNASIGGLSYDEKFSVDSKPYTFTRIGLRDDDKLLRGSKSSTSDNNTLPLSSFTGSSGWVGMLAVEPTKGVSINSSASNVFLVDNFSDTVQPTKLYGELLTVASGGYSLTNDGDYNAWENNYAVTVDATTVTISSGFKDSSIVGAKSGAAFTIDSLASGANSFIVTDSATGGASLSNVIAINQTGGLVAAAASGLQSVTANGKTIYNSNGLPLDVNVSGSDATLTGLNANDTFIINSTNYSINSLGLMTDNKFLKSSSVQGFNSAVLSEVADTSTNKWIYVATIKDSLFAIPPEVGDNSWLVLNEDKNKRYAQLTKSGNNYSIVKDGTNWSTNDTIQFGGGNTLSLTNDFRNVNVSVQSSGAVFNVSDNASYSVTDAASGGARIRNAKTINQSAGTIALSSNNQTINAAGHSVSGAGDTVAVVVSGNSASVSGLDSGEKFYVDGTSYTLLGNGRLQRQDKSIWDGDLIATTNGSINLDNLSGNYWKGAIETDANGNWTIDSTAANVLQTISSAFVVNPSDVTNIYGTLHDSNPYSLDATSRNSSFNSLTFTENIPVSLTSDFVNVSLNAGSNQFMARQAAGGFTVNYNNDTLRVDTATVVSLNSGEIILDNANSAQTIMANNQSVSSASESVNVKRSGTTVTIDGIETAGESVKVNRNTYTLDNAAGGGIVVKVIGSTTRIENLTVGDQFKIGDVTFMYTSAGLAKTASGSNKISYILKSIRPANDRITLANLQSTDENIWLGILEVKNGEVVINSDIQNSVVLVDNASSPTKNYGQIVLDDSDAYNYIKYDGKASSAIAETFEEPTSITVGEDVTATIASDFSSKPVKANNAMSITVTDSGGNEHDVGGTIEQFIPASMTFTPSTGDNFTVDDYTYEMTGAGLTKPDEDKIWTTAGVSRYILPDETDGTWSTVIRLTRNNTLDLVEALYDDGNNVIVNSTSTNRWANLTFDAETVTYALTSVDNRAIPKILVDNGTATFNTNFATTFTTGNGTYTINQKAYTGGGLEIDATTSTSTLKNGTVTLAAGAQDVTPTNDNAFSVTAGEVTATAKNGKWTELSNLSDGDTFVIDGTTYKVFGDSNLAKLNSSGEPEKLYVPFISDGKLNYNDIIGDNYSDIVKLNENNQLDLTTNLGISSALVVGQKNGAIDPTNRIAQLNYSDDKYTLSQTDRGNVGNMQAVLLSPEVPAFDTALATTVITNGNDTFTINSNPFVAATNLTVVTENGGAFLTNGNVTLAEGASVTTRTNVDETITSTTGNLSVTADSSANTVTISELDVGDVLQVGTNSYTMTSIGLADGNNQLNIDAAQEGSITTADLTAGDWKAIVPAENGVLTLNGSIEFDEAYVANVDTDNPSAAEKFGTLKKSDGAFTLTQANDDSELAGIILDEVKATLPTTCANTDITAQGATFSVTARRPFTVDATKNIPTIENARAINLTAGTIQATNNIPITAGDYTITTTSGTMTVGIDDKGVFVGGLDTGETFSVDDKNYRKAAGGLLDTDNQELAAGVTDTYYIGDEFKRIIAADGSTLDLRNETANAEVYDSISEPTTHMASLTVDGNTFELKQVNGGIDTVTIPQDATLTVDFDSTVNSSGATTVNNISYDGTGDLIIDATATTSTLQQGTITLSDGDSVKATNDRTALAVTNGTLTATASDGKFTTLNDLDSGDRFRFARKTYTQTAIGLFASDSKINVAAQEGSITTADLTAGDWKAIVPAENGILTLNSSIEFDEAYVANVDTDNPSAAEKFGTLKKSDDAFTLTQEDSDSKLAGIILDEVKATLPTTCTNTSITAQGATFSVTARRPFTIDATTSALEMNNVRTINLTAGTIQATNGIPITAGDYTITTTSGTMTVGIDDKGVFVGGLDTGETFSVDDKNYRKAAGGLLDTDNQELAAGVTDTYYIGEEFKRIIAADGSTLDLSNETANAEVYDSIENPTTHMASLTVDGNIFELKQVNGGIDTVTIPQDATLTVDFDSTVNSSGATTVNNVSYDGTGDLVIDATTTTSTLQQGTITLSDGDSIKATNDRTALAVANGTLTATASEGKFTTIDNLDSGDRFRFARKTYTQSPVGLINGSKISEELKGSSIALSNLTIAKWDNFIAPQGGVLNLTDVTESALVLDSTTAPTIKLAELTVDDAFTLEGTQYATEIEAVTLPENSALDVDFDTQVIAPQGSVNVNSKSYNAASEVIINSDGTTSTLYDGTVILDTDNPSCTDTNNSTVEIVDGSITATAEDGSFIQLGDVDTQEIFKLNDETYTKSAVGLMKDGKLCEDLAGETLSIDAINSAEWKNIIVPSDGTLDLSSVDSNSLICDDTQNPTVIYATLDADGNKLTLTDNDNASDVIKTIDMNDGTDLTVNFPAQVETSGTVTVNGQKYNGMGDLLIDATETTSTLTRGVVSLGNGESVNTTNGNKIAAIEGDGLTVTADGSTVTIDGMTSNDIFSVDDVNYKISSGGLINLSGKIWIGNLDPAGGLTVDELKLDSNWLRMVQAKDGALFVDDSTLENGEPSIVVDDIEDPIIVYGSLNRDDDGLYSLTKDENNNLSSIEVDGIKISVDNEFADLPITIDNPDGSSTALSVTASDTSDSFVIDATGDLPTVDDVNAIEISSGKLKLLDGQTATLATDAADVEIYAGNGTYNVGNETFTFDKLAEDTLVKFSFDTQGEVNSVTGFDKDSTVTIDGITYTAPEDDAVLHYNDIDLWYFDGFPYDSYEVTVDANGNVIVAPGARFTSVIASGRKLSDDGSIKFAADISKTPVTVTNNYNDPIIINDADDDTLTGNFASGNIATFSGDGVTADSLSLVAGTTFNLHNSQSLVAGDTTITANEDDSTVGISSTADSVSLDKSATVTAPADIALTLNAGNYEVNGVNFTGENSMTGTTTDDGVKLDLTRDPITYDGTTIRTAGTASTATISKNRNVSITNDAVLTNTMGRFLTVDGTVYLDENTISAAEATPITIRPYGFDVPERRVTISGDEDGYKVNLSENDVNGLESIGSAGGVTLNGLGNATVQTDKAGSMTSNDKTFIYDNEEVSFGYSGGEVTSITGADSIIGDFSSYINVNGDRIRVTGDEDVSAVSVSGSSKGVTKIEMGAAGNYSVGGKGYEIEDDDSFAFNMSGGSVTGIDSLENGNLTIPQDETGFKVNSQKVTLTGSSSPVTLGIVDSEIVSVSGMDGTINGLDNATVFAITSAVINGKTIDVRNSADLDAIVKSGVTSELIGLTDGATVNSAPNVTVTTAENGTFTFVTDTYTLEDTVDATFDFLTDGNSRVKGIDNFAGSLSGGTAEGMTLNGEKILIAGDNITLETDGAKITDVSGLEDGGEIRGDFGSATLNIPEGESTINGVAYKLEGDSDGASLSGNGSIISGLEKDATLGVNADGTYVIDGKTVTLSANDSVTSNLDGVYKINPQSPPISEKTKPEDILNRSENSVYVSPTESGAANVDLTGDNNLALIDSPNAQVSITASADNDSVVVRHGASVTVGLEENGNTRIIPTAGEVTLENYNGDNAQVQTFDYSDIIGAVKSNNIHFGNGTMVLGDAIIIYDKDADYAGTTTADLINAQGERQAVGFTHSRGGELNESTSSDNWLMKGNYAENSSDTQKAGGSTILTGAGNDTILTGAGDYVDAGGGENQIYLTDKALRNSVPEGATIVMSGGQNIVHNFSTGFNRGDDKILIKDLTELGFDYDASNLIMSSGSAHITFDNPAGDSSYEIKLTDGTNDYNAAVGKADTPLSVDNFSAADVFFGNENGISFSEHTGTVSVNLNEASGTLDGREVKLFNLNKAEAGAGNTSLVGAANTPNTLIGGTGETSIWSNSGRDLMVGNSDENKTGHTTFFYLPGDNHDSISNFDFMTSTQDVTFDKIQLDDQSGVTSVYLNGDNVVIGINNSADDYLTLVDAKGKSFRLNDDIIAKVDTNVEFDGFTNCYVGTGENAILTVGEGVGDVEIWLSDDSLEYHGVMYDGNFGRLDASAVTGNATLAGNELNNSIIGGSGNNSIWGGYSSSNDTLVGGAGQNTFFFAAENGHDVIQNAHDGDIVSLEDIYYDNIARAEITDGGAHIELTDGSSLEIQSTANINYRLQDGSTYTADRTNREWVQK